MLSAFIAVISLVLTISLIVGLHEFGHFLMARCCGVKVLRFSIGFGKLLFTCHDKHGTEYAISAIPLGGYVKMLNDEEDQVASSEKHLAYNYKAYYQKFLIVAAGPAMNLALAFVIYWGLFITGFNSIKPITGNITKDSIASLAGMQPNQEIKQIDHQDVASWLGIIIKLLKHAGDNDSINITTSDQTKTFDYHLNLANWEMDALRPDPLSSLGIIPFSPMIKPLIAEVEANSPAALAGIKINDEILSINHVNIKDWGDLIAFVDNHPNQSAYIKIRRHLLIQNLHVVVGARRDALFRTHGFLGIQPEFTLPANLMRFNQFPVPAAFVKAANNVWMMTQLNLMMLKKILTGKISLKSLGGPISIFESAGTSLNNGFVSFFSFIAFLSISIGVINILPVPGLDGGHLLIETISAVKGRPLSVGMQVLLFRLGMVFILMLMTQAIINDILRI